MKMLTRRKAVALVGMQWTTLFVLVGWVAAISQAGEPVFHLNFAEFRDVSGNDLAIEVGSAVSLVPGGGPTLGNGTMLDSARWAGEEDDTNEIRILDNPILDEVAVSAGSIVAWIKPDDGDEWNNIAKTVCLDHIEPCDAFGRYVGFEFQASGIHAGVFGAVQGWDTNVFGPDSRIVTGWDETDTPTGEWTHAALVWNDVGDHTIFVNGDPGDTEFGVGADDFGLNEPEDWTIGGDGLAARPDRGNPDDFRYLSGELADFAIYDGELTRQEIQEIMQSGVPTSAGPSLQAGDADQDLDFDQIDLVLVQQAAKYLTGDPATWGEGDWNGAPGGSPGNPPPGNGVFDQLDIIAALAPGHYLTGPYGAISPGGARGDGGGQLGDVDLIYLPVPEPASMMLLAIGLLGIILRPGRR